MCSWNRLVLRTQKAGSPLKDYFRYFTGTFFFLMLVALRTVMLEVLVRALSYEDGLLLYKRGGFYCGKVLFTVGMSYKCK